MEDVSHNRATSTTVIDVNASKVSRPTTGSFRAYRTDAAPARRSDVIALIQRVGSDIRKARLIILITVFVEWLDPYFTAARILGLYRNVRTLYPKWYYEHFCYLTDTTARRRYSARQ